MTTGSSQPQQTMALRQDGNTGNYYQVSSPSNPQYFFVHHNDGMNYRPVQMQRGFTTFHPTMSYHSDNSSSRADMNQNHSTSSSINTNKDINQSTSSTMDPTRIQYISLSHNSSNTGSPVTPRSSPLTFGEVNNVESDSRSSQNNYHHSTQKRIEKPMQAMNNRKL